MLAIERRACIKETIQEQKSVAVSDLARRFDVTEETIRRDLKVLESQGVLTRQAADRRPVSAADPQWRLHFPR